MLRNAGTTCALNLHTKQPNSAVCCLQRNCHTECSWGTAGKQLQAAVCMPYCHAPCCTACSHASCVGASCLALLSSLGNSDFGVPCQQRQAQWGSLLQPAHSCAHIAASCLPKRGSMHMCWCCVSLHLCMPRGVVGALTCRAVSMFGSTEAAATRGMRSELYVC